MPLSTFADDEVIDAARFNANFALCVLTDTARTVTVTHTWSASQTLNGGFTGGSSANITINTNKFTVAASTGNTLIAGTLTQQGLATFSAGATVSSGQTLTITGATVTGLTAASVGAGTFPSGAFVFDGALSGITTLATTGNVGIGSAADGTYNLLLNSASAWKASTGGSDSGITLSKAADNSWRLTVTTLQLFANVSVNGNVIATTDATNDIGASGATRFRDAHLSRNIVAGGHITTSAGIRFNTAATFLAGGGIIGYDTTNGLINYGKVGSSYDWSLFNPTGATVIARVLTGATDFHVTSIGLNAAASTQSAGVLSIGNTTQSTVGAAGGASALPATPTGYIKTFLGSTQYVIPYYAQA